MGGHNCTYRRRRGERRKEAWPLYWARIIATAVALSLFSFLSVPLLILLVDYRRQLVTWRLMYTMPKLVSSFSNVYRARQSRPCPHLATWHSSLVCPRDVGGSEPVIMCLVYRLPRAPTLSRTRAYQLSKCSDLAAAIAWSRSYRLQK